MKKLLTLSFLTFFTLSSYGFESGIYECDMKATGYPIILKYTLKDNNRAKKQTYFNINNEKTLQNSERGNWQDDDDAAIIISNKDIIEKIEKKYYLHGSILCNKIK